MTCPLLCCKAELMCSSLWARKRGSFFRALYIAIVERLHFSVAPLCLGTVQVAWENQTSRILHFVAGWARRPLWCSPQLCYLYGLGSIFFPLGILGSAEFVLCFAEERACWRIPWWLWSELFIFSQGWFSVAICPLSSVFSPQCFLSYKHSWNILVVMSYLGIKSFLWNYMASTSVSS